MNQSKQIVLSNTTLLSNTILHPTELMDFKFGRSIFQQILFKVLRIEIEQESSPYLPARAHSPRSIVCSKGRSVKITHSYM